MSLNSFKELQITYSKAFYNASELLDEAQLLLDNKKYARGYFLSHIAIEELARCIMLASAIIKFKIRALDVKKLIKRQTSHQSKIEVAYSFVEKLKNYTRPLSEENRLEIMMAFANSNIENIIDEGEIQKFDDLKNASLYVDQYQNVTKVPSEVISTEQATELVSS
ncbi:AbiV family abortive infection protein [Priestia megaterium]|uniref:AbiV family abortive infection protein n=1 Tax=Priestia megaterium TaxID=1404 RepID=UPI00366C7A63